MDLPNELWTLILNENFPHNTNCLFINKQIHQIAKALYDKIPEIVEITVNTMPYYGIKPVIGWSFVPIPLHPPTCLKDSSLSNDGVKVLEKYRDSYTITVIDRQQVSFTVNKLNIISFNWINVRLPSGTIRIPFEFNEILNGNCNITFTYNYDSHDFIYKYTKIDTQFLICNAMEYQ